MPKPLPSSPKVVCISIPMLCVANGATSVYLPAPVTGKVARYSVVTALNTDGNISFGLAVNNSAVLPSMGITIPANNQQLARSTLTTGLLGNGLPANVTQDQSVVLITAINEGNGATPAVVNIYFRSAQ